MRCGYHISQIDPIFLYATYLESVKRNSVWRGSEDENSDEDESLSNTDSFKPLSKVSVIRKTPASGYSTSLRSR